MPLNLTLPPSVLSMPADNSSQPQTRLEDQLASRMPAAPHSQTSPSAKGPMLAALLGGAADVATTQYNLAQGGYEQNPMLPQGRLANGLALGGSYVANALLSKYLNDHGHSTMAKLIGYGGGVDGGVAAIHNILPNIGRK